MTLLRHQYSSVLYLDPLKKPLFVLELQGHCALAVDKLSLFKSHLPTPLGSVAMAGPPDQKLHAGYMMS